jgi:hypothetical protein
MRRFYLVIIICVFFSCEKPYSAIYESSDAEQVSLLTDTCLLASISSTNFVKVEEAVSLNYASLSRGNANLMISTNFLTNKIKTFSRVIINDTLSIVDGDSIFLNKKTRYVDRILTNKKPLDLEFDQYEYRFIYKDSLLESRLMFINGDTVPYFESKYTYVQNNLTKLEMFFKPANKLIFETNLVYDKIIKVKPWLYFNSDFFNIADYLLMFNFGAMPLGVLTSMESFAYAPDDGQKIGEWKVKFSNYKISKDKYVLKLSSAGDRIQSLPYLFQNTELKYKCSN